MGGYWVRHRLLFTVLLSIVLAVISCLLFVYPAILQEAEFYNEQSVYQNSEMSFVIPEPSFEQAKSLSGNNGIDKVFPFFLTRTQVNVNGTSHKTTVLLSDQFQNVGMTMYNPKRLIEASQMEDEKAAFVDWEFCKATSAQLGDKVSFSIGGNTSEYTICKIYETNSIYAGGTILVQISEEQKETISTLSNNNGYSGIYLSANNYDLCRAYLTTEYRPLGRLKSRDQFSSDEQYQVHYDAIMSSGYANEITDFEIRKKNQNRSLIPSTLWIASIIDAIIIIMFNVIMARRGCEKVYFQKQCIPKGQTIRPYYTIAFFAELILIIGFYAILLAIRIHYASEYIPQTAKGFKMVFVPVMVLVSEVICFITNNAMISRVSKASGQKTKRE